MVHAPCVPNVGRVAVTTAPPLLVGAGLLVLGVFLSKTSSRFGVPSLILFLGLGMLAGSDGLLGIAFDDFALAQDVGIIALAFILFSGGASAGWRAAMPVLVPGVALATVGVLLTAAVFGVLASLILQIDLLEGLLLGAITASTDAAAVFSILRSRGVRLGGRLRQLLELESGSNDPAAVFLTIGVIGLIQGTGTVGSLAMSFIVQMGVGLLAGIALGWAAVRLINRLHLEYEGLYPVLTLALVLITYELTDWLHGSGFLATYVAGMVMADADFLHKRSLLRFHDALGWLSQIAMFVIMGLLVFPSALPPVAGRALLLAALLAFVARPVAVFITVLPLRMPLRDTLFVSWVGLRGATPIILATFPVVAGVPDATTIFHVVFFIVLLSVLVQGTTIPAAARRLGLAAALGPDRPYTFDDVIRGDGGHALCSLRVGAAASAVGRALVDLRLPSGVIVVLLRRAGVQMIPKGGTVLEAGDELLLLADERGRRVAEQLFAGPME